MDGSLASRRIWNDLLKFLSGQLVQATCHLECSLYQVIKDTFVKLPFLWTALPELLIVVIKATPMLAELSEAVFVDILNSVENDHVSKDLLTSTAQLPPSPIRAVFGVAVQTVTRNSSGKTPKGIVWCTHCTLHNTYTDFAHLVTLLPSFKHFISPCPAFSVLHCMKSSL